MMFKRKSVLCHKLHIFCGYHKKVLSCRFRSYTIYRNCFLLVILILRIILKIWITFYTTLHAVENWAHYLYWQWPAGAANVIWCLRKFVIWAHELWDRILWVQSKLHYQDNFKALMRKMKKKWYIIISLLSHTLKNQMLHNISNSNHNMLCNTEF
jgi:hypothetical protein